MSGFHESIKSILSEFEKFLLETLKNEKLGKSAKSHKQEIIDKISKLKEEYPALGSGNATDQTPVKLSKDTKDDESTRTGGSSNTDEAEDPYSDSSADIPSVGAMELTGFSKAGFLEKKKPAGLGLKTWQKRWCVIKGNIFYYFNDKTSKKMSGAFRLSEYSFQDAPDQTKDEKKKELYFKLVRPANRTYEFMALSKTEVEEWKTCVKQASSLVVPSKDTVAEGQDDGDIYEPVGEEGKEPGELYDDAQGGDIYEDEPVADKPAEEPVQEDVYDDGASAPIQDEEYEDASTPMPPPPKRERPPPPPPPPEEDPYQGKHIPPPPPPSRSLPKTPDEVVPAASEKIQEEPKSYRNEEDFENMYVGKWDCSKDNDKELSFKKGDIIYIINKDYDEKSWWVGELNGQFGLVPKNYLTQAFETLTF